MNLMIVAAVLAVCGAAKLDRTYLPPSSADTAGGSPGALQTPLASTSFSRGRAPPKGSFNNDFEGVVVDAASAAGPRSSEPDDSGLGAPRPTYGSMNSKVGFAAFGAPSNAGFRQTADGNQAEVDGQETDGQVSGTSISEGVETYNGSEGSEEFGQDVSPQAFGQLPATNRRFGQDSTPSRGFNQDSNQAFGQNAPEAKLERAQAASDRAASTLRFVNEVGTDSFNYAFETDNGISAEESGVATDGVRAQGAFSYTGDDGQVYSITYTADENGYQPKGAHLPTPPPIPVEILRALEQNARDEAAGVNDDGSYDAQKYNTVGAYSQNEDVNNADNKEPENRPDATASGTFADVNATPIERPNSNGNRRPTTNNGFDSPVNQRRPVQTQNRFGAENNDFEASPSTPEGNEYQPQTNSGPTAPIENNFEQQDNNQSPNTFGSNNGVSGSYNSFNQASNGLSNEYLPPVRGRPNQGRRPQPNHQQFSQPQARPQTIEVTTVTITETPDFEPSTEAPRVQPSNGFRRPSGNGRPNQVNRNGNGQFQPNRVQNRFGAPTQEGAQPIPQRGPAFKPQRGTAPPQTVLTTPFESQGYTRPSPQPAFNPQRATVEPQRELTTPFESTQETGSEVSEVEPTQASNFGRQPAIRPQRPSRPYGGLSDKVQMRPIQQAQPQEQYNQAPQFGNRQPQVAQRRPTNGQRPNSNQYPQQAQGEDDSYYYNKPSKAFTVPSEQSSYSEEGNQLSNTFQSQNRRPNGGSRFPNPPTVAPTAPAENELTTVAEAQFNGITQASASPFTPEPANLNNRFGSRPQSNQQTYRRPTAGSRRPTQNFNNVQTPSETASRQEAEITDSADARPSQQYSGEIYEYSKPAVTLPPPAKTGIAASQDQEAKPVPTEEGEGSNDGEPKNPEAPVIGTIVPAQPTRPAGNGQRRPYGQPENGITQALPQSESRPKLGSTIQRAQCCRAQNPNSIPQPTQAAVRPTAFDNRGSAFPGSEQGASSLAGKGEVFGGPRNPPRFDSETGYHY